MSTINIATRDGRCPCHVYRPAGAGPWPAVLVFMDGLGIRPALRKMLADKFRVHTTLSNVTSDAGAFLDALAAQPDVKPGRIGVTGYCMGGSMALAAAGTYPERIAAAIEDPSFPDDMKQRLEEALTNAGVVHTLETYPARHGWVFRDTPVYDAAASERHWRALVELLDSALK
jgi:carboxymethylenebutenolidase